MNDSSNIKEEISMESIMTLFKGIFYTDYTMKIGLSQFKEESTVQPAPAKKSAKKETKLSDLMRGQC
ncbi:hypothetical protein IJF81_04160 [bacterium]|nr:hypothetical protein [bacterium]